MTRFEKLLRQWGMRPDLLFRSRLVYIDVGSHTTKWIAGVSRSGVPVLQTAPTCAVVDDQTGAVLAVGARALSLAGKLPPRARLIFPVRAGKIVNAAVLHAYLSTTVFEKVHNKAFPLQLLDRLHAYFVVSDSLSLAQKNAWQTSMGLWGSRAHLLSRSKAVWAYFSSKRLFIDHGCVLDAGAMTTSIWIFSGGVCVSSVTKEWGGNDLTLEVQQLLRTTYQLEIGWKEAEMVMHQVFASKSRLTSVYGKDVLTGLPTARQVRLDDLHPLIERTAERYITWLQETFQHCTAEAAAAVTQTGIVLIGGLSVSTLLAKYMQETAHVSVHTPADEGECVKGLMTCTRS